MSRLSPRTRRWLVPGIAAASVVTFTAVSYLPATAEPGLPEISATELVEQVLEADVTTFSGTVESTVDLGLPDLTAVGPPGMESDSLVALLTSDQTANVWVDDKKARLAVMTEGAEYDVVSNGSEAWLWSSPDMTAYHYPDLSELKDKDLEKSGDYPTDPAEASKQFIEQVGDDAEISVGESAIVADRKAYRLRIEPTSEVTTVGQAEVFVDAQTWMPLKMSVAPRTAGTRDVDTPALQFEFTSVDFDAVDPGIFEYTPPADASVVDASDEEAMKEFKSEMPDSDSMWASDLDEWVINHDDSDTPTTTTVGENWDAVKIIDLGSEDEPAASDEMFGELGALGTPVDGTWGSGTLITTRLVNIIITDDQRVAMGAVLPEVLDAALAE